MSELLENLACKMFDAEDWGYSYELFHLWLKKISIFAQCSKHLSSSLAVPNVRQLLLLCMAEDVLP